MFPLVCPAGGNGVVSGLVTTRPRPRFWFMLVRGCEGENIQVSACISILLLLTVTAFGQIAGISVDDASPIPWRPFQMQFPSVAFPPTVPKEMVNHLMVANWPIILETTKLTDAQRQFGGLLGTSGDAGDSLRWVCLYRRSASDGWVLWLTSGEIDGESIGSFVWRRMSSEQKIDYRCKALGTEQGIVTSPIPLQTGHDQITGRAPSR